MERCYAFGRALAQVLERIGVRAVLIASGGMSHFPGTRQYSSPNLAWDQRALEPLRAGNLRSLLAYDEKALDESGNIELRCWAVAAGALSERKPDLVQMNPSWHHNYASLAWWSAPSQDERTPHYPSIAPDLVRLTDALQAAVLIAMDLGALAAMGVHPLVSFLANMQLEQSKKKGPGEDGL